MLEGPLKTWICHFLGQYVESETVHVSTKLWTSSERLKLENLTLKKSVIPAWLPFKLKTGFIGQFEADLPISAIFGSGSAKIKFSDVLLVLAPLRHDEDEQREEIESLVEQKLQHLEQDVLDRWEGPHVPEYTVPHESEGYFGVDGWLGRTITKLIDNLQIDVRNLHIRIEGVWFPPPTSPLATAAPPRSRGTSPTTGPASSAPPTSTNSSGVKFAAGFSLSALSAVTTPSNWRVDGFDDGKPTPNTDTSHLVFKLINALDLSVYVDPNALHFIHSSVHPKVLQSALSRLQEMNKLKTSRPDWWNSEENVHTHRFLIAPIAVALKLTMNTAAQHAQTEDPRYNAAFHLSKLAAALDEEQLSVLNLIIDSYCRHEEWRVKVSEQLKADERAGVRENDKMGSSIEEYLGLWKQVDELKKGGLEQVKTTPAWKSLTDLERGLPFELVVSLRNRGSTDQAEETNERASFSSLFHEMGDAMGIPLPEISVVFTEGPTGLVLDITKNRDVVVVSRSEQGQAAKKESVKPGLIIVAVDGKPLKSVVKYTTAVDVQVYLDSMQGSRSITFRHPLVVAPEVTPQRLVSKVVFTSDDLSFRLVRASKKLVLAKLALDQPLVMIRGYGPELFSFHQYEVLVLDFYLQNNSWDPNGTSYCIASSVTSPRNGDKARTDRKASFRLGMDYLYDGHPDAVPGKVSTYGSKISLHVGDSVLVIDDDKMTSLMTDWYEFCAAISSQYADSSSTIASEGTRYGTGETVSLTSSGVTIVSNNTIGEDLTTLVPPRVVSSYSYDFKVDQIMIFVTAASKAALPASITSQPSYRTLLKQLVNKESSSVQIVPPDWVRATQAIVLIQRFLRGAVVRKRQLVQIGLSRSRWMRFQSEERMGWLYSRDDTLAFRRWRRSWCHVGEDGVFSIHTDGSGAELLDEFKVRRCNVTLVPNTVKGPWGLRKTCHLLEIRSASTGQLRKVLSSEALSELEVWRSCIELSARNAIKRRNLRWKDRTDSTMTTDSTDPPDVEEIEPEETVPQPPPMFSYEEPRYSAVAAEALLMGGFSDSYESSTALHAAKSKWISINATDLHFMTDVHRVSEPQQSAFHVYIGVQYLSVLDHRKKMNHGLLHIGDEFLGLKNGVLTPARIRADRVKGGPFLALSLSYRGAHATTNTFDFQEGLHADLDISGWCLPLNLYEVMFEVLDVISVFWTDPTVSQENQETDNASNDPWYRVAALDLHIRAPIIEGYLEDTNCVAKLSLENSVFGYKADRFMESAKIHLGPTALFVLTDEVALRLAQVEKCWINYELRMQRFLFASDAQQNKCDLCQDENAKRAVCHRSVTMTLGQVKLEADRRLELLFALIEALTSVEEQPSPDTFPDDEFNFVDDFEEEKTSEVQPVASQSSASRQLRSAFDGAPLTVDCLPTERLQRMMQFDDHDLRPMYAQFGRQISAGNLGSPSGRSRLSSATTAQNWQSQDENVPYDHNGNQQSRSRPVSWIPLLNYQVYIGILPPEAPSRTRTLFRLRLRSGRIHDHISLSCSSIVFEVIKRSLSVVALDTYIPVMNFSISDMKVLATTRTEFSNDAGVDASVETSARYYNSALADWEPFVEPWRTYARITVDDGENGTSVQLSAMQRLNVNITDALVRLLSSMAKNRKKQVTFFEKRTPSAVAADGEAKKEDGRVCVLNNLGAPIRLANLNTSQPGTLHVEVRDGWSYPAYTRFHDVRVQVVLLPWWHPREAKRVDSIRHKFSLPYGGAQSGVTPILRVDVSTFGTGKRNFVFDQVARRYVEVEGDDADLANDMEMPTLTQHRSTPSLSRLARDESSGSAPRPRWCSIGSAEINLVGSVMGSLGSRGTTMSRWYRLRDERGNVTGEIFVALDFVPFAKMSGHDDDFDAAAEPDQVRDGQFLVFDPLKTLSAKELKPAHSLSSSLSRRSNRSRPPSSKQIVLSHGLRASYVPPLALEVMLGGTRCSLLCPLRRAGKFLIQGDRVLAEVKVAQRDESRRVLLLSSPVQLKNATSIDIELWSCPTTAAVGESGVFGDARRLSVVSTSSKLSVPLSAIYGESQQSIIIKVDGCKPTVVANLGQLSAGSLLIMLDPEEGHVSGFCLFVSTTSYMRKVYREEHQDIVSRGVGVSGGGGAVPGTPSPPASQAQPQSYATKYQICLHACLVFENTLPVRVQYRVVIPRNQSDQREILLRSGTLSPGEDVNLYEFHSNAHLLLRLPEMDSIWCKPIDLGDCMYREGMGKDVKAMLNASGYWAPIVEFIPSLQSSGIAFKEEDIESKKVVARLDYTNAEDGSPRVVLYASLWIYNQSHVPMLQFRCADDGTHSPTIAVPQIIPQRPVPRPMDCPNQTFEISTVIDYEVSRWSEKIHATVVGIQAPIPLKFGSSLGPKMRYEIGISIQRPLGQFHRTTQVIVMPRFVIVNKTTAAFKISPHGKDSDHVIEIPAADDRSHSSIPFDFDAAGSAAERLLFIRMDHTDAEWSGPFAVDEETEFPLKLQGNVESNWKRNDAEELARRYGRGGDLRRSSSKMYRVKVRIHTVGPTMVVSIMRDDPATFVIRNESSWDLYVNQQNSSEDTVVVRTKEFVPFAWARPERSRRVTCRVGLPGHTHPKGFGSRVYDFNNLDRDRGIDDLRFWLFGNQLRRIQADISVEESSRVLVFRDHNTERPTSYVLEVKVIAARFFHELSIIEDPTAEIILETDNQNVPAASVESKELRTAHVYRFDADSEFSCESRPKRLTLSLYQNHRTGPREEVVSIGVDDDSFLEQQIGNDSPIHPTSPTGGGEAFGMYEMLQTPSGSPRGLSQTNSSRLSRRQAFRSAVPESGSFHEAPLHFSDVERVSHSDVSSDRSEVAENVDDGNRTATGVVEIKIPRKAWSKFGVSTRRSVTWSYNNMPHALYSLGGLEGHWWEMRDPESGELVGEVQVALKFRTTAREYTHPTDVYNVSVQIPSIGFSFLHNASSSSSLVDVAYLSLQRLALVYSCVGDSSEVACSLGNLQMDNQMDAEVVLGPKVHHMKEGVSVRLRDRWRGFRNHQYRGICEQLDTSNLSFLQFRTLWNSRCKAGDITHYELVEFIMQEVEISTDEKFVVNLITVFQGLGTLSSHHTFDDIVNTQVDYTGGGGVVDERGAVADGVYIEELHLEAIRVKFSMELNGGRHLKTLGPSGRRLAVYLPESNVKDFRLYFSTVTYTHVYETKANVVEKITRRYQQQAVILVLRGLYTVSVYANPFRIAYRLGHGILEVFRLPARGLASGSPVELVSGAYLGVRSLAMNTISAGYEIVAGASAIVAALVGPLLPESRRRAFEDEMLGFQRAVIEEVDSFDAAEERTMTKVIVRKPREFDVHGVGLLTVYGPGSVPMEEQDRIDYRAAVVLQQWWRRHRRANRLWTEALRLRPDLLDEADERSSRCNVM